MVPKTMMIKNHRIEKPTNVSGILEKGDDPQLALSVP